jgi:hypothetical protein
MFFWRAHEVRIALHAAKPPPPPPKIRGQPTIPNVNTGMQTVLKCAEQRSRSYVTPVCFRSPAVDMYSEKIAIVIVYVCTYVCMYVCMYVYTHTHTHTHKKLSIPVTGRGGLQSCEIWRLSHFQKNRLTDGGKVVSLTRWSCFAPLETSWYLLLL